MAAAFEQSNQRKSETDKMGTYLANLSFLQPLILLAFISLPLLWLLLRVTPPPPKVLRLPTYHFIKDLIPQDHTSKDTPLWLLLLRLLALSLIIIGFAGPVLNAQSYLKGQLPPRIIIDNSWAGAANWEAMITKATHIAEEAERADLTVQLVTMAADPSVMRYTYRDLAPRDAIARLKTLEPQSWSPQVGAMLASLRAQGQDGYHSYLLSSGLAYDQQEELFRLLSNQGGLDIFLPQESNMPYLLSLAEAIDTAPAGMTADPAQGGLDAQLRALESSQTKRNLTVNALDSGNAIIDSFTIAPKDWDYSNENGYSARIRFELPPELVAKVRRLQLRAQKTAGTTLIVDPSRARKDIGIVQIKGEKDEKAYIGASFYLQRALSPYADITLGRFDEILEQKPAIMIIPDDVATLPTQLNALEEWLKGGGILIRFAGPRLMDAAQGSGNLSAGLNSYLPVTLRRGGRSMGGQLSWDEAQALRSFAENSLFYGLPVSEDIKIKQMVLAEPGEYLDDRSWARLEDGTPLVTYDARENGLVVLFHTAATPDWSTLPLSGLYVTMLKRIIDLSAVPRTALHELGNRGNAKLAPVYTLNGYGDITAPAPHIKPVHAALNMSESVLSHTMPAGLYAGQGLTLTLNVARAKTHYEALQSADLPLAVDVIPYQSSEEQRPGSFILILALLVLLADLIACFVLMGLSRSAAMRKTAASLLLCGLLSLVPLSPATAQNEDITPNQEMMPYANNFYLAYIRTGDSQIDNISAIGLEELAFTLNRRTSAEPSGIKGINLEQDVLSFFPIIYWPVTEGQSRLPADILAKIQNYLDHGGMILFDLQNNQSLEAGSSSDDLQRLIGPLNIAPLEIVPEEHALRRSFYLLDEFPGDIPDNPLWVERREDTRIADAGSVLIGSNQWADAWARGSGSARDEMAMRFGINLVMYALTGNYKTDQVHVKHILERLGE